MLIFENFVSQYQNFYSWDSTRTRDLNASRGEDAGRRCHSKRPRHQAQHHRCLPAGMHLMLWSPGSGGDIHATCRGK